jgi:hypothetical protein
MYRNQDPFEEYNKATRRADRLFLIVGGIGLGLLAMAALYWAL